MLACYQWGFPHMKEHSFMHHIPSKATPVESPGTQNVGGLGSSKSLGGCKLCFLQTWATTQFHQTGQVFWLLTAGRCELHNFGQQREPFRRLFFHTLKTCVWWIWRTERLGFFAKGAFTHPSSESLGRLVHRHSQSDRREMGPWHTMIDLLCILCRKYKWDGRRLLDEPRYEQF